MENCKPKETIVSERIVLKRRFHECDDEMWPTISGNREFLREYLFWVDKTQNFEDVVEATDMFIKMWEEDTNWCYNIYRLSDNKLLGCIDAHSLHFKNQHAELGYWLSQSETRKGYMKEAVRALEKEIFDLGFHRVVIECDIHNQNSRMVAQKSGYTLESIAKEALYHYTGLHDKCVFVKFSPYPVRNL